MDRLINFFSADTGVVTAGFAAAIASTNINHIVRNPSAVVFSSMVSSWLSGAIMHFIFGSKMNLPISLGFLTLTGIILIKKNYTLNENYQQRPAVSLVYETTTE